MAVTSQSTLKELVDETTVIKDDLVNCRDNLKNNLSDKGVDVASVNKMQGLVEKVKDIKTEQHEKLPWNTKNIYFLPCNNSSPSSCADEDSCVCIKNNKMYTFTGGYSQAPQIVYDISENKRNEMFSCRLGKFAGCGIVGDYIYLFTAINADRYRYIVNTLTNTYESKRFSYYGKSFNMHTLNECIYIVSGDVVYTYNTVTDTINEKTNLPKIFTRASLSSNEDVLYIADNSIILAYNIKTNTCEVITESIPNPTKTGYPSILAFSDQIFMFRIGGVWEYSLTKKSFTKLIEQTNIKNYPISIKYGKGGFLFGGNDPNSSSYISTFDFFTFE